MKPVFAALCFAAAFSTLSLGSVAFAQEGTMIEEVAPPVPEKLVEGDRRKECTEALEEAGLVAAICSGNTNRVFSNRYADKISICADQNQIDKTEWQPTIDRGKAKLGQDPERDLKMDLEMCGPLEVLKSR